MPTRRGLERAAGPLHPAAYGIILAHMPKRLAFPPPLVESHIDALFHDDLHAQRVRSLADGTLGVLQSGALGIHAIGRGLAVARGLLDKHAIKQMDRLIGNDGIKTDILLASWATHVIGARTRIVVNLDWTEVDDDDQAMLVVGMQTDHGRSTPLAWQTVVKSTLAGKRNDYEDALLTRLRGAIPTAVHVTVVADRGFADQHLYAFLEQELKFDYIIRFRSVIHVANDKGETRQAKAWLGPNGRMRVLRNASVTADRTPVATVVCVQEKGMKDAWCIVASDKELVGRDIVQLYGKRFSIEEMFRDMKDLRYGMGMSWNKVGTPVRRDRMFLVAALAHGLLTLLGAAGESLGFDRMLKANTVKTRTLSLFRQGLIWYERIPTMPSDRLRLLSRRFGEMMSAEMIYPSTFGGV